MTIEIEQSFINQFIAKDQKVEIVYGKLRDLGARDRCHIIEGADLDKANLD